MESLVGTDVAGYRVEALLGRGGMGVVYRARQRSLDRPVALKVIAPQYAQDPLLRARFVRESRLAASIDHPNVIPIYEADERDGLLFLAMRYVEGSDLRQLLADSGPLPPERVMRLIAQIAAGLDAAHAQGLVHRDVKPANVLVASGRGPEHAYLTDFGLVKRTTSDSELTQPGAWAGTPDYVAPEQLRGAAVDHRADVYALGCLLFEVLTGHVPFPRDSDVSKLMAHLSDPPPLLASSAPDLPEELDGVVQRALAKAPGDRFAAAGLLALAVRAALSRAHAGPELATRGAGDPLTSPPGMPRLASEERKQVTVVCVDLDSRELAGEADPERRRVRVRAHHAALKDALERNGGTIEPPIGDALMAVFGAPASHEDDVERAVWAALRVVELAGAHQHEELTATVGMATGEAIVSTDVSRGISEAGVSGAVVSTAIRVQAAAPPGSVAVDAATFSAARELFEFEALAPAPGGRLRAPVELWTVLRARARVRDGGPMHSTPFIGREVERTLLQGLFERCVRERLPQVITLVGEPGIGKSRLVDELFASVGARSRPIVRLRGRCLAYGEGITFWALGEIVKSHVGVLDTDPPDVAAAKLDAVLPEGAERPWLRERVLPLLGMGSAQAPARQESFTAWRRFLEHLAYERPAVIVIEDLHWADPALLEFTAEMARSAERVPLLLVCTARPELYEIRSDWGHGLRNATTITLPPLSDADTATLLRTLVPGAAPDAERDLVGRIGGNPLYAEEFARLLHDARADDTANVDALARSSFPARVQALIAARLDRLGAAEKRLLQSAAVIGDVFWDGAVCELTGRDHDQVAQTLRELSQREFVRPARSGSIEGQTEFTFWHALVRDVAYDRMPRTERALQHDRAARWIEREAGARTEDVAEMLAHHLLSALALADEDGAGLDAVELTQRARRCLRLAGERALRLDASHAEGRFARALELMPMADPEWPELMVRWAEAALQAGQHRRTHDALTEAMPRLEERAEPRVLSRALMVLARLSVRLGIPAEASSRAAVAVLESLPPGPELVRAYLTLADSVWMAGRLGDVIESADRALEAAALAGLPEPGISLGIRGLARMLGRDPGGAADVERALTALDEQGDGYGAAGIRLNYALVLYVDQGPATTLASCEASIEFCESRGLGDMARYAKVERLRLLVELGRPNAALAGAARLLGEVEMAGDVVARNAVLAVEVLVAASRGDAERAAAHFERMLAEARESQQVELMIRALAAGASAVLGADRARAVALLNELAELSNASDTPEYARALPEVVRVALRATAPDLVRTLVGRVMPVTRLDEHVLRSARAALAEHDGDLSRAASIYAEAAAGWTAFGCVPERAYALLGGGRCSRALGRPDVREDLRAAEEIFRRLDYAPALAEAARLLGAEPRSTAPPNR
jgi:class 3 adenylate cyclase/tetratricopeptide (TPR) repeat protein